jgi:DNA (cytosine-5)-methyltransferase 1
MNAKPRLLDLFSGAGGCAKGYELAGFDVALGVDRANMPRYPYDFLQVDALEYLAKHGHEYDFIHASPPCQVYSRMRHVTGNSYEDFLPQTRKLIDELELPYVIENVIGAPLKNPVLLCGTMFGLNTIRHRIFECGFCFNPSEMPVCQHQKKTVRQGYAPKAYEYHCVTGNFAGMQEAKEAMNIDWMTRKELSQAIPPQFTQFIGAEWLRINGFEYCYPQFKSPRQRTLFAF